MFWKIFLQLCEKQKKKPAHVADELNIGRAATTKWKNGTIPNGTTLIKLAQYFNTTTDYLLGLETEEAEKPNYIQLDDKNIYVVPIFETVSAGLGAFASDYISGYMPMYFDNGEDAKNSICIKVQGDSMYPKIEDGDIVLVRKQDTVESGSIAVLLIDNEEGVVKRIFYGADWIELQSFNPTYRPIRFVKNEMDRITIIGEVKKIIKNA